MIGASEDGRLPEACRFTLRMGQGVAPLSRRAGSVALQRHVQIPASDTRVRSTTPFQKSVRTRIDSYMPRLKGPPSVAGS